MNRKTLLAFSSLLLAIACPVAAGVVTNIAPSGVIIDTSGSLNASFTPVRAIDGITSEATNFPTAYWLAPAGATNAYFILDLMRSYTITSAALYNTHNRGPNDCGTAQFTLTASDTVGPNFISLDRYYPLNGDLNDHSTNANAVNAIAVDASLSPSEAIFSNDVPAAVTGLTRSLALSGQGESVEIPDPVGFAQPTAYSYSLWVKFLTNDTQTVLTPTSLVLRSAAAGAENQTWSHQLRLNANGNFEAYLYDGDLKTLAGTTAVQPGVWYHVASTVQSGGLMHLYVNGVEEGTPLAVGSIWAGGSITEIGTGSGGNFLPAPELITDLGIWYSSLSPDRIKSLSQGQSPLNVGGAKGLVLVNPRSVVSGTLSDVSGQAQITPNVFNFSSPVTARYIRFDALTITYPSTGTNSVGLNELQLMADAEMPVLSLTPAVEVSWPPNPFALAPLTSSSLTSSNWGPLPTAPTFDGSSFTYFQAATNGAGFYALPGPSSPATITTNVAPGGSIIAVSSTYNGTFTAANVIDGRTDEATSSPATYWLASDGVPAAEFILDLRKSYSIASISIFNTHNRGFNDRGTAEFELYAGDGLSTSQSQTNSVDRYYPFDGDVTDKSGNQIDAQVLDGPSGNVISGTYSTEVPPAVGGGKGILLSRTEERIEIPDASGAAQPTAYSLSLWVKFSDLSQASSVIARTTASGSESNAWSHQIRVTGAGQFQAYLFDGSERSVTGKTVAQPGTWYHVVATARNGDMLRLYVNGKEEGTPASLGSIWGGGALWSIGTGSGGGYGPMSGEVDDLGIWFSVLSADTVNALFSGAKPTAVKASTITTEFANPRLIASGSLSDTSGQDSITADDYPLSPPITTRYLQFKALTGIYASGNVGLNEIQANAAAGAATQSTARAVLLTWPYSPFNVVLQSSPDGQTWTTVSESPVLSGSTYRVFRPFQQGIQYRLQGVQ